MTPLAAQLFRFGDEAVQRDLARCQFFECTELYPLVREMTAAELKKELPDAPYSRNAHLPAPYAVIEALQGRQRVAVLCAQVDDTITFSVYVPGPGGKPAFRARSGFVLGTQENLPIDWTIYPGEPPPGPDGNLDDQRLLIASMFAATIEKYLVLINQPGLVDRRPLGADKRVLRVAKSAGLRPAAQWHRCTIRPGVHGHVGDDASVGSGREHQLHYVRKHYKPSLEKWIDGYWRGNADLGIHFKWYSVKGPSGKQGAD